jgi:hypothetical protein
LTQGDHFVDACCDFSFGERLYLPPITFVGAHRQIEKQGIGLEHYADAPVFDTELADILPPKWNCPRGTGISNPAMMCIRGNFSSLRQS